MVVYTLSLPSYGHGHLSWQAFYEDETMVMYSRTKTSAVDELAVQFKVKSHLSALVHALLDVDHIPEWVFAVTRVNILQKYTEKQYLTQMLFSGLGPIDARDRVTHMKIEQDHQNLTVVMDVSDRSQLLEKQPDLLRMTQAQATWQVRPCEAGHVVITYQGYIEPEGFMPHWWFNVLNRFQHKKTFLNLRAYLTKPAYQKKLSFIKEPPASFRQWSELCDGAKYFSFVSGKKYVEKKHAI